MKDLKYPTKLHQITIKRIVNYFKNLPNIDTILLVNSLARGKGTLNSDIDMAILINPENDIGTIAEIETSWTDFLETDTILNDYKSSSKFSHIHLDIINGVFEQEAWEAGADVNYFEVEIGNRLLYSKPLAKDGDFFKSLKAQWLPYYDSDLQIYRLNQAKKAFLYEIEHIPIFIERQLYFQSYDRLNVAFRKFLQALFIRNKIYPISYNKWIKEQIVDILKMPELYVALTLIFSINKFESDEIYKNALALKKLFDDYI